MNERIRLLAEQACAFADIQYNKQTKATFYTNKSVEEFFREKFAELIVEECFKAAMIESKGHMNPNDLIKRMKERVGVEE